MSKLSRRYFVGMTSLAAFGAAVGGAVMTGVTTALVDAVQARRDRLEWLLKRHREVALQYLRERHFALCGTPLLEAFDEMDRLSQEVLEISTAMVKDGEKTGVMSLAPLGMRGLKDLTS